MKKALTIALAGAAMAATLSFVMTGPAPENPVVGEAKAAEAELEPATTIVLAQNTASVLTYERGPRIIIVPQAGDRVDRSRASVNRDADEENDIAPPPVRTTPRWAPRPETPRQTSRVEMPPRRVEAPVKPRAETRQEIRSEPRPEKRVVRHIDMSKPKPKADDADALIPQPPSPRRAVLSAPPLPAEGPSPIKPTPRFGGGALGAKAEVAKPAEPPVEAADDSPPPGEVTADSPPPGYTPPAGMPRDEAGNKY